MRKPLAAAGDGLPALGLRMAEVSTQGGTAPPTGLVTWEAGGRRDASIGLLGLAQVEDLLQVV